MNELPDAFRLIPSREIKCVEAFAPIHSAQVITYLKLITSARQAFLLNFNGLTLMEGLKSFLPNREHGPH